MIRYIYIKKYKNKKKEKRKKKMFKKKENFFLLLKKWEGTEVLKYLFAFERKRNYWSSSFPF